MFLSVTLAYDVRLPYRVTSGRNADHPRFPIFAGCYRNTSRCSRVISGIHTLIFDQTTVMLPHVGYLDRVYHRLHSESY